MTDLLRLVSEADTQTLPTLSQLSDNDIDSIWADVSAYIVHQMTSQKGVHVAGLGTFTFSQQQLDLGNRFMMIQDPIFLLARKLVQSLGLKQTRPVAAATHLPVVQLNFTAVSKETPFSRGVVEGCIRETLLLLFRALASEKNVSFTFRGIGVLFFTNKKVRMKFNKRFINAMDGSGRLLLAFNNRPGSSVSLLSGGQSRLQRALTGQHDVSLPTVCSPQLQDKAADQDGWCLSTASDLRNAGDVPPQTESQAHQPLQLQPVSIKATSSLEELATKSPTKEEDKHTTFISSPEVTSKLKKPSVDVTCSDHEQAGQELCYLCMQRARRNVPVYLREQQHAEEKAQDKLLLFREQQRDKQHMEEEQERLSGQREHAKQVAIFNLQMSEKREKTCLFPTTFIFPSRPLTPTKWIQQQCYMKDLQSQIKHRQQHEAQDQKSRLLKEQLDQVQLVQEIAMQKAQQLQQKYKRAKEYKMALDTQVKERKHTDSPECQTDNSGFPRCQTAVSNRERREQAQKLFHVNFSAAAQRKREELHNHQAQLEKERQMLKYNKTELILDCINHIERRRDISKTLEDEWRRSAKMKRQQAEEERRFLRSAGQLLVDQLVQYKRCCQCKRRTSNFGETDLWKDSYHISGPQSWCDN